RRASAPLAANADQRFGEYRRQPIEPLPALYDLRQYRDFALSLPVRSVADERRLATKQRGGELRLHELLGQRHGAQSDQSAIDRERHARRDDEYGYDCR